MPARRRRCARRCSPRRSSKDAPPEAHAGSSSPAHAATAPDRDESNTTHRASRARPSSRPRGVAVRGLGLPRSLVGAFLRRNIARRHVHAARHRVGGACIARRGQAASDRGGRERERRRWRAGAALDDAGAARRTGAAVRKGVAPEEKAGCGSASKRTPKRLRADRRPTADGALHDHDCSELLGSVYEKAP